MKRFARSVLLGMCLLVGVPGVTKQKPVIETFEATLGGSLGVKGVLIFNVEEFSTEPDVKEFARTYMNDGKDALQKSLNHVQKGHYTYQPFTMSAYNVGAYPIRLIRSWQDGEFRNVYIVADAADWDFAVTCCAPYEEVGHRRGYPFTVIYLRIDQHGKGTGQQIPFAAIVFNKQGGIDVNSDGTALVNLTNVHAVTR
jgi:hypothetical protein